MSVKVRRAYERGIAEHGWLHSRHTFSFGSYYDPSEMGFGVLRVINEDKIEGGTGFGTHGHQDMEIISYVVDGALEHKDSMGNKTVIRPGEIQRMSAGTGVHHSEYNHNKDSKTHFLQIWIIPEKRGIKPSYDQMSFESKSACSDFFIVASQSGRDQSITLNQNADIYVGKSKAGSEVIHRTFDHRGIWIQVVKGEVSTAGEVLKSGDGAGITEVTSLDIKMAPDTEFLLFDLPSVKN